MGHDTRTLHPGELYAALRGERHDGHCFLPAAAAAGAAAALVDEGFAAAADAGGLPLLVVPDTRAALLALGAGYRSRLPLTRVGVSGSVGKTTVKELAADMLGRAAPTFRNPGNWNNDIGLPLSLLRVEAAHRHGVFELGVNHPGEMAVLCDCLRPDAGILTRVGPVHIGHFAGEEEIAREKAVLFSSLPAGAPAVISRQNPWFTSIRAASPGPVVTTAVGGDADYCGRSTGPGRFTITETASGETVWFSAPLPGGYFLEDALLAVALARRVGVGWDALVEAVAAYAPPPLRWNRSEIEGRIVIDDSYNANPVSMTAALEAFAEVAARRHWVLLGGMRELGGCADALHREVGAAVAGGDWAGLIAFGPWGRLIAEGARTAGLEAGRIFDCPTHADAVDCLAENTKAGDAILIKASRAEALDQIGEGWRRRLAGRQARV